jgi:FlaA1/EpsC-like NDP-sugar epimerase
LLLQDESVSTIVIVLFGILLFIGLIVTRFSFRILDLASFQLRYMPGENGKLGKHNHQAEMEVKISSARRVLIYGAGNKGDIAVRWLRSMPNAEYLPVGFIDRDPNLVGRKVSGIEVLGTEDQLIEIIEKTKCDGVILAEENMQEELPKEIVNECITRNCWIRVMKFSFEMLNEE